MFMGWKNGTAYGKDHQFSPEELLDITPEELVRWFRLISFGTETPGPEDRPTIRRSTGISFCKKAISYFMADGSSQWNTQARTGNPTMSKAVNKLIAEIKKHEVRKQGKTSNAKRDMKRAEFKKTLRLLQNSQGFANQYKVPTMLKLQFHLIARTDDICNLESVDLREHEQFGTIALQTKVAWSKNVNEERECPEQIILGANDPDFCSLIGLACYLESRFTENWGSARFLFGDRNDDDEPLRMNHNYGNILKKQWSSREFKDLVAEVRGSIGTHSIRKFASTWASEHGCTYNEVEIRGRWKGGRNGRVVNLYINVKQLPTDGKVAAVLCVGQPVKYKLKANSGVTRDWLLTNVVPGIRDHYDSDAANRIADVLSLPLLYACLEPSCEDLMIPAVQARVRAAWIVLCTQLEHENDWNPVEKVVLQVHRYENQLVIDELLAMPGGGGGGGGGGEADDGGDPLVLANRAAGNQQQLSILTNQVHQLKQDVVQAKMENLHATSELRSYCQHQFGNVHTTLGKLLHQAPTRRVANRPANAATAAGTAAATVGTTGTTGTRAFAPLRAGLSKCPRSLHDLWREWTDGLEGNKPASQIKRSERGGKMRYVYFNRKIVWDVIKRFTDKNISHLTAIDNIETAYGRNKSLSHYIACLKRDKKTGGHPNLVDV
jgi:Transcriptional activator of glycolytic enzymes